VNLTKMKIFLMLSLDSSKLLLTHADGICKSVSPSIGHASVFVACRVVIDADLFGTHIFQTGCRSI